MLHNGDMYFNCSFNLLSWWMFLLFKLITQHMWDMSIFIAIAYRFYLTPLFSFRWLMMNVRMKGMGLAAPLALLYHHKIIAESCNNKDNRCCLLYLIRNNNPASLFPMCSLLVVPCISAYYLHVFLLLAFVYYVEVPKTTSSTTL